jgi:3-oxoacyl-[acyl-carrier protein] reductase
MNLNDKKIIVTGAAQGIGASALRAYVAAGAEVAGMDIDVQKGESVAASANAAGPGSAFFIKCDVADRAEVDASFDTAVGRMGKLDVLAHIAGVHRHAPTHEVPDETLSWLFNVNVNGTIYTNGAAYRHMPLGGSIINFGSESGLTAEINNAVYGASKAAVHAWGDVTLPIPDTTGMMAVLGEYSSTHLGAIRGG